MGGLRALADAVGTFESAGARFALLHVLPLAAVEVLEVGLGVGPIFVGGGFVFPRVHLLLVEHFAGVHVLHVVLDFGEVGCRNADVPTEPLLFVKLPRIFCDVGGGIPLDAEVLRRLLLL